MPLLPLKTPTTAKKVVQSGTLAAQMLQDIANATNLPYLSSIAGISLLLIETVQVCFAFQTDTLIDL